MDRQLPEKLPAFSMCYRERPTACSHLAMGKSGTRTFGTQTFYQSRPTIKDDGSANGSGKTSLPRHFASRKAVDT